MSLSAAEVTKLKTLIRLAQDLLAKAEPPKKSKANGDAAPTEGKRIRRTGKELLAFRKMLKAERKKGVRVEELASKHGISTAYIYTLGG